MDNDEEDLEVVTSRPDGSILLSTRSALTPREVETLRLLASGAKNREIAAELFLSVHTVEYHVTHILQKLGARNRTEAGMKALRLGLYPLLRGARLDSPSVPGKPTEEMRPPVLPARLRFAVPLALAISGALMYLAISGMPFDPGSESPMSTSAQPSETNVDPVPAP